jgi:hypothetical protein
MEYWFLRGLQINLKVVRGQGKSNRSSVQGSTFRVEKPRSENIKSVLHHLVKNQFHKFGNFEYAKIRLKS